MKEKIENMSEAQLMQLAHEMTLTTLPEDALTRTLMPEGLNNMFALFIIEINAHLVQVLAERLKNYMPI